MHPVAFVSAHNTNKISEVFHVTNVQRSWTLQRYLRYFFLLLRWSVCVLEICMPPSFFDLMEHMLIHLVDDLEICVSMGGRWLYPLEWKMGALKFLACNKAKQK